MTVLYPDETPAYLKRNESLGMSGPGITWWSAINASAFAKSACDAVDD
jgi:hypothetical protein